MSNVIQFPVRRGLNLAELASYEHQYDFWEAGLEEWADQVALAIEAGFDYRGIPEPIAYGDNVSEFRR